MSDQRVEKPIAIDLFAGAGGLTQGLRDAGFIVVGAIENDSAAAATYAANHPEVRLWEQDIREVTSEEILTELQISPGELSLLAGCPPCQGFTTLRTHNKSSEVSDRRNELIDDFLRLVEGLLPKTIMMENAPNLARDARMTRFLERLASLGYWADTESVRVLNTADFGVPQRRRRMILMVSRSGPVQFARPIQRRMTVREAIGDLPPPGSPDDLLHDAKCRRSPRIEKMIRLIPIDGGSRSDLPEEYVLDCHKRVSGFRDVYGRMAWSDVAPTITSGCTNPSKGRFLHPEQHRAITLREAAILQGFRDDSRFILGKGGRQAVARMIGNALPPEFVRRQAEMLKPVIGFEAIPDG